MTTLVKYGCNGYLLALIWTCIRATFTYPLPPGVLADTRPREAFIPGAFTSLDQRDF